MVKQQNQLLNQFANLDNQQISRQQIEAFFDKLNCYVTDATRYLQEQNTIESANCAPYILKEIDNYESFMRYAAEHFQFGENKEIAQHNLNKSLQKLEDLRQEVAAHAMAILTTAQLSPSVVG